MAFKTLPTFYYHTHFCEFLKFIKEPCKHLLSNQHQDFISTYENLEHPQQCLLVRLINRKHYIIKTASLVFSELDDIPASLDALKALDLIGEVEPHHVYDVLQVLTKSELIILANECTRGGHHHIVKSANKEVFLSHCQHLDAQDIAAHQVVAGYLVCLFNEIIEYFLFLYFGHLKGRLNHFSMRDLGIMRTRETQAQMRSRFASFDEAFSCYSLYMAYYQAKRLITNHQLDKLDDINAYINKLATPHGAQAIEAHERLIFMLAKHISTFNLEHTIKICEPLQSATAQEYWCRQAYKIGLKDTVHQRLQTIIDNPPTDKLLHFAEDFLARKYKQKRTSILTDMLKDNAQHLHIDETFKGSVEQGVIAYYKARGIKAYRTENFLWQNLFGLVFWNELFNIEGLGLATPFDYLPNCIKHYNFLDVAKTEIESRLESIKTTSDLLLLVTKNAAENFGKSQGIIRWHKNILDPLKLLIQHTHPEGLKHQLLAICSNWQVYHDGYPDIMVLENGKLRFEEIKAPGDSLRRNQLLQIQSLKKANIDVHITTLDYVVDPMQPYAVIDIETTGGRANLHRITEIGLVKVVNGEVIEQWQSLINPQRNIPKMITSLTGITNDMVIDAPLFADVAEQFDELTSDCIFVAHNVNFDYGFIREEFARLGQTFRRPKMCTVQQMRKHYKGLTSYSLANLTQHFNIGMTRHHRALSDAVAAAELLNLINEKRLNSQTEEV